MTSQILTAIVLLIASYWLTRLILSLALHKDVLDHPNERSSHTSPTPRIGGLAFVIVINLFFIQLLATGSLPIATAIALIIPPTALAIVGLLDDIYQLSNKVRLALQVLSVATVLILIQPINIDETSPFILLLGGLMVSFVMVWVINLFNFMDGIDGIAGTELIFVLLSLALLLAFHPNQEHWTVIIALTTLPVAGFLITNWPPAKIFMGDVGSTYLGLIIGIFCLIAIRAGVPLWSCVILLGTFLCDATWTLLTRILTRQRWFAPHRSHTYQKLARRYASHSKVTLAMLGINIFWLLPLALMVNINPAYGLPLALIAYIPLLVICYKAKAGLEH
jgi:Fuc2NAc and GlcNAc transferase